MHKPHTDHILVRSCAVALFVMVLACAWDIWWHVAIGRDDPFIAPHIPVYVSLTYLLCVSGWKTWHTKNTQWKHLCFATMILPLAAGLDQAWHALFGSEDISQVLAVTSPPHLMLVLGMLLAAICILAMLHDDPEPQAQEFFGSMIFASLLTLGLFYTLPFHPTFGWALLGFAGAGIVSFVFIFIILCAANWKPTFAGATLATLVFLLFYAIAFGAMTVSPDVIIYPHDRAPMWLFAFACLVSSALTDLVGRAYNAISSAFAGFFFGAILFGFSSTFFAPEFQYDLTDALVAIAACAIGGALAGLLMSRVQKKGSFLS